MGEGHLFVVHGRVESVIHDHVLVPTSSSFRVREYWHGLLGSRPEQLRPDSWPPKEGFARARGRENVSFVNVGGRYSAGVDVIIERAVAAVSDVAHLPPKPSRNRTKPLVAVPVLGIAGGGLGGERGDVVRQLLAAMSNAAHDLGIDIAVITPDASVYGAAQHVRRENGVWPFPQDQLRRAQTLGAMAQRGELALFMGAGVSVPAGLPTCGSAAGGPSEPGNISIDSAFKRLTPLDQAQLLSRRLDSLGEEVARIVSTARIPSLGHSFLAALRCREAITTNCDRLYREGGPCATRARERRHDPSVAASTAGQTVDSQIARRLQNPELHSPDP